MNTTEKAAWLEARRKCITGTDISQLVGVNPWGSPMNVFMDKLGLLDPLEETEAMRWGKILEPVIAARYSEDNGLVLVPGQFVVRDEILGGTPDYLSADKLIEVKTGGIYAAKLFGEPGTDDIPDNYMCQVQWYLNLTEKEKADLVVLIAGQDYRIYNIHRNQGLIDILVATAKRFWDTYVLPQIPPPMDASKGTDQFLKSFFPRSKGNMIPATASAVEAAQALKDCRDAITVLEKEKAELENIIKYEIGSNDGIENECFKITWKTVNRSIKTEWEKVAKALNPSPELIDQFSTLKSESRRFLFTVHN